MSENRVHTCYRLDEKHNIWVRPEYGGIAYSDGNETENHLKSVIDAASDVSVMSVELVQHCKDWPSTYHLSRKRSNLLRPFVDQIKGKSLLEIGAGCGAITRFLGETGADIVALEGSPRRASIASSRCRDLDNVVVVSDNFQTFQTENKFEVVTLIGVLEYARSFVKGKDPIAEMLSKAASYLVPNGILIIAIENQLGLKYFAGYNEDHVGKPMYGIEEHYTDDSVVTFGRQELSRRVANVGLVEQNCWYPFPDYKMPTLLVSESGGQVTADFDLATLVQNACIADPQSPDGLNFFPERAWSPIIRNNLLADVANSFVLLASQDSFKTTDCYAVHYATERRPEFAKQVMFLADSESALKAKQVRLYSHGDTNELLEQKLIDQAYTQGVVWHDKLISILTSPNWSSKQIIEWWDYWWQALHTHLGVDEIALDTVLEGKLLDAMPRNLLLTEDGRATFIDLEWYMKEQISPRFLMFRALLSSFQSIGFCAKPQANTPLSLPVLIKSVLSSKNIYLDERELSDFIKLEAEIQWISGGRRGMNLSDYQGITLRTIDTLMPVHQKISHLEKELNLMKHSLSWKLTSPLRNARDIYRAAKALIRKS